MNTPYTRTVWAVILICLCRFCRPTSARKMNLWLNWYSGTCAVFAPAFSSAGRIMKMERKYQNHSFHFVFYTLSPSSCFCFTQSRQTDTVLPSFPYQNSLAGTSSLADCVTAVELGDASGSDNKDVSVQVTGLCNSCFADLSSCTGVLSSVIYGLFYVVMPAHFFLCQVLLCWLKI